MNPEGGERWTGPAIWPNGRRTCRWSQAPATRSRWRMEANLKSRFDPRLPRRRDFCPLPATSLPKDAGVSSLGFRRPPGKSRAPDHFRGLIWPSLRLGPRGAPRHIERPRESAGASGRRVERQGLVALEVVVDVAKLALDDGGALEVVADGHLVGHAHAAVQLDGVLAHEAAGAADLHLGGRQCLGPLVGRLG